MEESLPNTKVPPSQDIEVFRLSQLTTILDAAGINYSIIAHKQTYSSAQEGAKSGLGTLDEMAPTFILSTGEGYISAIIRGDTRLSYKKIKQKLDLKNVSLAAPELVRQVTGSEIGHVALVNLGLKTIVDERVTQKKVIYGGCGIPNHTLRINPDDVIAVNQAQVFDFTELKVKAV